MENQPNNNSSNFIKTETLKLERRLFFGKVISIVIGYAGITLWLNAIRTTWPIGLVWVLIVIQFILYFSIFVTSYQRSKTLGLNENIGIVTFGVLAFLGRVNDWELLIIPLLVIIVLIFSARNKKASDEDESLKNLHPDIDVDIAEELKYIVETSLNGISKEELDSLVKVGRDVVKASWIYAKKTSAEDKQWRQIVKIQEDCVEKYINKLDAIKDVRLIEYLRHANNKFYLSSCRGVAMDYAIGQKDALEEMKSSIRYLKPN